MSEPWQQWLKALTERLDNQINLMAELRVGQVVANQQMAVTQQQIGETQRQIGETQRQIGETLQLVGETQRQLAATNTAVLQLTDAFGRMLPVIETQQRQLQVHQERIEDLYRAQGHILRRLFGEEEQP
ncbi:MAG: hypothetical protein KME03_10910 [Aphanocapsa lilacina HA4352-LM1]|jgi:chromosome segregation ATPase|nr:hypothetical protein [Aphanocapsa lilacina HA4352-LM1]